jgi:hypothetical protein
MADPSEFNKEIKVKILTMYLFPKDRLYNSFGYSNGTPLGFGSFVYGPSLSEGIKAKIGFNSSFR